MNLASPATSLVLFWTITRAVALAVIATEALFLLKRARASGAESGPASRFVWTATPAVMLAGLALWCAAALPARPAPMNAVAIAHHDSSPR